VNDPIKILGIAGSLRKASYNRAALRAARDLVPAGATLETFELDPIPIFNAELERTPPPAVAELKARVRAVDALLFATPEYNFSVPGVLKNAIDWGSRPLGDSAWTGKPAAIMSAATGMLGGARAQYHLRQTFVFLDMHPVNKPEVMIPFAAQRFDEHGALTDEATRTLIGQLLQALVAWTRRLAAGAA
jgi:chromate reductase